MDGITLRPRPPSILTWIKITAPWALLLFVFCGGVLWIGLRENMAQNANRARCEAAQGRYFQHGEKYWSGLCIRPGGILWERLP